MMVGIPIPCVCSGIISRKVSADQFEVEIYSSPVGQLSGAVVCGFVYTPGASDNYRVGDYVKVIMSVVFDTLKAEYVDISPGSSNTIIGKFREKTSHGLSLEKAALSADGDKVVVRNEKSGSGVTFDDYGNARFCSGGAAEIILASAGFGVSKDSAYHYAQNHHRVIANNPPLYLAREHFGMFSGADADDESSRQASEDVPVVYRRFVTKSQDISKWVSICEGAFAPFVGANNSNDVVDPGKDVLYTRMVNNDDARVTVEAGEPGESFYSFRVDKVSVGERSSPASACGASSAVVGNMFKVSISDEGLVVIKVAGSGTPGANTHKAQISIDADGNMKIHSSGTIELTHGDNDSGINSIVMDPSSGIDITAKNGLRFNGQEFVMKAFIDWMSNTQSALCQVTSIGGPAPIQPAAIGGFNLGVQSMVDAGGFTSTNVGAPASGIITETENFRTV